MRTLVAIPVFNEEQYVPSVVGKVLEYTKSVLVIDDGSTDRTPCLLPKFNVDVIRHAQNRGYGRAMRDAFTFAANEKFDWVITMDCDEQHEPASIPAFVAAAGRGDADLVSGSRYLSPEAGDDHSAPPSRRAINMKITKELNERLGLELTDSFCGFKAYRVAALEMMKLTEDGYAFPLQFWVQAAAQGLRVREIAVPLIYKDLSRTFGATLNDPGVRLAHYREVMHCEIEKWRDLLPARAGIGVECPCAERRLKVA